MRDGAELLGVISVIVHPNLAHSRAESDVRHTVGGITIG